MKRKLISILTVVGILNSSLFAFIANAGKPSRVFYVTCVQYDNDSSGSIDTFSDSMILSAINVPSGVARVEFVTVSASVTGFRQANRKSNWQYPGNVFNYVFDTGNYEVITSVQAEAFASNGTSKGTAEATCGM